MSEFVDKKLTCKDCHNEFTFTADDQEYFAQNGWSDPVRCKPCRRKNKARKEGMQQNGGNR